ncbi:hypothetical protein NEMBOFW57_003768 [Staphylotrichum longicolle]|uniref:Uncharacterized protein n=1 Tax=Staphylotrichum longicolle TaxID=669026 RepID=A0AAD4F5K2_9PEZI|nr:hypothetical protein NEMBOFW57_003768 [Staphylotrichum longicolle]
MRRFLSSLAQDLQNATAGGAGGYGYGNGGGFGAAGYGFGQTPQVPQANVPCPRQQPQAGHQDWIGLNDARFAAFNICPTCYNSAIRPTPYASAFVTKGGPIAPPLHVAVRCDMSRFWVRVAGLVLLTMNQDRRHDVALLAHVAGIRAQEGACPNAQLTSDQEPFPLVQRMWYTVQEPQTVCEQCYAEVIRPDVSRASELARQFDPNPSLMPSGFTCQLYSDRMRRIWSEAGSTGNLEYLRQKVQERRAKEREWQMKTAQLQQQANQLRLQAQTQEHLAANSLRLAANTASNNIMLAGVGVAYRIDANHVAVPNGVPDFSQTIQLNNQAAMLKVQAAQAEDQIRFAEEEWRRYWE